MRIKRNILGATVCGLLGTSAAQAVDFSQISINGFGSIIGGMTLDEDEEYFGVDDQFSFQPESRFALQVSAPIGNKWSATAQIMARGSDNFAPNFEWAYVGYQATDNLKILAGRHRFNLYKYSNYLDVGYAYPWIRLPQGTYSLPFNSGDGLAAVYNTYAGDLEMTFYGSLISADTPDYQPSNGENLIPAELDLDITILVSMDANWNDFNFGFNFSQVTEFTYDVETAIPEVAGLVAALRTAGTPEDVIQDILSNEDAVTVYGIYFGYDPGPFFLLTEYSVFDYDPSFFAKQESIYVTAGARYQKWTFHATYGMDENTPTSDADERVAAPFQEATRTVLNSLVEDSTTTILGVRYDVETGIALKGDFTMYQNSNGARPDAKLVSVGVDFVF